MYARANTYQENCLGEEFWGLVSKAQRGINKCLNAFCKLYPQ